MIENFTQRRKPAVVQDDVEVVPTTSDALTSNEVKKVKTSEADRYKILPLVDLFAQLKAKPEGLTQKEALERTKTYGLNVMTVTKKLPLALKFVSYFKNPLIIVLLICATLEIFTGEYKGSAIIIAMIFLSMTLNFYQEHKSEKAAEELAKKLDVKATVLRDGIQRETKIKYLVPGDVVMISAGDIIPADGRIIESDDLFINESSLTGESFPLEKGADAGVAANAVFSGTNVASGYGKFLVIHVGAETEFGKIADKVTKSAPMTAFEIGTKKFGFLIIKAIVLIVVAILLINALNHKDILQSIIFALAVAVGITPELLPMIMSMNMSRGAIAMAKKGVIVKRLNAIPDFGSMDILCTDKTGTLTEDKITLVKYMDIYGKENHDVLQYAHINGSLETGIRSILDRAILAYESLDIGAYKKIDEIPYDFMRKRVSIVYEEQEKIKMVTKGAPEEIFKICTSHIENKQFKKTEAEHILGVKKLYDELSSQGFRVLAVAIKDLEQKKAYGKDDEVNMTLVGLLAFFDPPKQSAKEALQLMEKHGIEIKILTGDGALVTKKVCHDLGLHVKGILTGDDLDINVLEDEEIAVKALQATIFARLSPSQKDRVISALRKKGFVVGYLGDGINDAPSFKTADVGISVSNAVDIAKESADIILVKKGLKELLEGVIEGRKTFSNSMKYMMMGLSSSFGNMFSMIGAVLFLPFFPMLPGQILLNNLLYDASQVSLPSDNVDDNYLKKPKHRNIKFIRNFMLIFGPVSSIFDFLTFYILYAVYHLNASMFQTGRFIESLMTQTLVIYVIRTRKLPFIQSRPSNFLLATTLSMVCVGVLCTLPRIGDLMGFTFLPGTIFGVILGLVITYLVLVELVKRIFYGRFYKTTDV